MTQRYVSPLDDRVRTPEPLATRPAGIEGLHVTLLDIRKNRGSELLDTMEELLRDAGATTSRAAKEIFSKPAAPQVIDEVAARADLVVEALAD